MCFNIASTLNVGHLHFEMCSLSLTKASLIIPTYVLSFSSKCHQKEQVPLRGGNSVFYSLFLENDSLTLFPEGSNSMQNGISS